ncbi:ankyrin repeat protein [Wolbachia endosymbiont of Cylisticus convexus]|uniref:ankyrin repeat domain-containing protein n=1 Tax=Wolbachia endosymbiont of Cylisticus convexus TaxID=118728 RepID=UPI000DF6DBAF|nr:ankyrin repeat domain-containing protein [Wolbachia endosymbiont of Cylisticus convexus]RDD34218.1 ankyrin repeat protein [Wolbachia endosymbiont of Cylisticus convexus]
MFPRNKDKVVKPTIDEQGNTPLHTAAWEGNLEVVKLLLKHGADVHAENFERKTPLHFAAWEGGLKVVKLLLKHRADVHAKDFERKLLCILLLGKVI